MCRKVYEVAGRCMSVSEEGGRKVGKTAVLIAKSVSGFL